MADRSAQNGKRNPFGASPANSRSNVLNTSASNPFDDDEVADPPAVEPTGSSSNPFADESSPPRASVNPFESSNPFDNEQATTALPPSTKKPPHQPHPQPTQAESNPFAIDEQPRGSGMASSHNSVKIPRSESGIKKMNHSESGMRNSSSFMSSPKSLQLNPFSEDEINEQKNKKQNDALHMIPPREARSNSVVPPFIEGEVSCVILASCTGFQVMKNPKEHAVYTLTITATLSMKNAVPFSWSVKRRNKQFETLHASLSQSLDVSALPPLPKKGWTRNLDSTFLETRRQGFDRYIQAVIQEYGENTIVCTWLCDSFHKMLLPFLHKQMEDRVTTDQLRHHLSAAVIREHELEQTMNVYTEREQAYVQKLQKKENECVSAEKKSEEYKQIAERAYNENERLKKELSAQIQQNEQAEQQTKTLQEQIKTLQDELEQTIKKLKEKPVPLPPPPPPTPTLPLPTPSLQPSSTNERKLSIHETSANERKPSISNNNNNNNPFGEQQSDGSQQRKLSAVGGSTLNLLSTTTSLTTTPSDPASIIESLSKPLFEPQQVQWICVGCSTENKLPIVQCISCRLVKPLSFFVELTITNIHKVQRSAKEDPFVEYLLQVKLGTFSYLVRRRFSDFEKLHDSLIAFFGKMDTMPVLPKSQMGLFGGGNSFDPAFLQQRRTQLQAFLHGVAKHSLFFHCGPLCAWLVLDSVDGLFGPLLRAATLQRSAAEQLAEHVQELEATVSTKTQLLVETLELRNRLEEALEAEKANVTRLTADCERITQEMHEQKTASEADITRLETSIHELQEQKTASEEEITRLQNLLHEQTQLAKDTQTTLLERVTELDAARKESTRLTQESAELSQQLALSQSSLQGEQVTNTSLTQQLESALMRSAAIAHDLAVAEARIKQDEHAADLTRSPEENPPGIADGYCASNPALSQNCVPSSPSIASSDTMMTSPYFALGSSSLPTSGDENDHSSQIDQTIGPIVHTNVSGVHLDVQVASPNEKLDEEEGNAKCDLSEDSEREIGTGTEDSETVHQNPTESKETDENNDSQLVNVIGEDTSTVFHMSPSSVITPTEPLPPPASSNPFD